MTLLSPRVTELQVSLETRVIHECFFFLLLDDIMDGVRKELSAWQWQWQHNARPQRSVM